MTACIQYTKLVHEKQGLKFAWPVNNTNPLVASITSKNQNYITRVYQTSH